MIGDFSTDAEVQPPRETAEATPQPRPIDELVPRSDRHGKVLEYLLNRLNYSERSMSQFYNRWNVNEKKLQAYINLPNYEQQLREMSNSGSPPQATNIVIPYSYATIWTIVTYLIHTFAGQKPIFPITSYKQESVKPAQYMETVLQFNADHTRLILQLIQWFIDAETYGVGALRVLWHEEVVQRSIWTDQSPGGLIMPGIPKQRVRVRQQHKIFEGNKVTAIDPFMFFPDPRVPMNEVNRRGEFVFWRSYEGKHTLKREEKLGNLKWVDEIGQIPRGSMHGEGTGGSSRSLVAKGDAHPGDPMQRDNQASSFYQIDQGTVEIIPKELGLGDSDFPEKWLFSIGNKTQIIQAEPLDLDHGRHPIAVIEPASLGYAFGQPGTLDFLGPVQDTLSWFINSHVENVRTAMNNMWVADPSMIEMQDLKQPGPGKIIRLKRSAYGQDVRMALQQLQVQDVTSGHMNSMEAFLKIGDTLAAINDNLRGIQDSGGRRTATETRTSAEAGASRLAARARYISAQGMIELAEQMAINLQQNLSMEYYLQIVGAKGLETPIPISPEMIAGDFQYPVHDGTLPIDKTALLGVWKELWLAVTTNPLLMRQYDAGKMFEFLAELGGAKNIGQFKVTLAPDEQVGDAAAAGGLLPIGGTGNGAGPRGSAVAGAPQSDAGTALNGRGGIGGLG